MFDQKPIPFRDIHYIFRAVSEMMNTCGYILCNGNLDLKYEAKKTLYQIFLDRRQVRIESDTCFLLASSHLLFLSIVFGSCSVVDAACDALKDAATLCVVAGESDGPHLYHHGKD